MPEHCLLVGDIGGTNARLQLWTASDGDGEAGGLPPLGPRWALAAHTVYRSSQFGGLEALVVAFLTEHGVLPLAAEGPVPAVAACCLAVCGPVEDEQRMCGPVLDHQPPTQWGADAAQLTAGALAGVVGRAVLINDFVSVGYGLPALPEESIHTLHAGKPVERGVISCIGAGSGLGAVFLTWQDGHYRAWASEGGMNQFQAHDEREWRLRSWLQQRKGHVTVETVVSGPGIANAYEWLCTEVHKVDPWKELGLEPGVSMQEAITERALATPGDAKCREAVGIVMKAYGSACRTSALWHLPRGGLYLAGGLAPKLLSVLKTKLTRSFLEGDPLMGNLIADCPLHVVLDDNVGLLGARVRAHLLAAAP